MNIAHEKSHTKNTTLSTIEKQLYAGAWQEDLQTLSASERTAIARNCLAFIRNRKAKVAKVRSELFRRTQAKSSPDTVTILEIVNDDMPFLVDSVINAITAKGYTVYLVLHPVIRVERDKKGILKRLVNRRDSGQRESILHIHLSAIPRSEAEALEKSILLALGQIRSATRDWKAMLAQMDKVVNSYKEVVPPIAADVWFESIHFLEWLKNNNFTFLGLVEYTYDGGKAVGSTKKGLGILSSRTVEMMKKNGAQITIPKIQEFAKKPLAVIVSKTNEMSKVHRLVHMDYIAIKTFSPIGKVTGELRVIGLFTSSAYTSSVKSIPLARRQIERVLLRSEYAASSHLGKGLVDVLETYPRDELFQIEDSELYENAMAILHLQERPQIRAIYRYDKYSNFVTVMIYVPRSRYSSTVRTQVTETLEEMFQGKISSYTPTYMPGHLVRVYFVVDLLTTAKPSVSLAKLEKQVDDISQSWESKFVAMLDQSTPSAEICARYQSAFPAAYRDTYDVSTALTDIPIAEDLNENRQVIIKLHSSSDKKTHSFKIYSYAKPIALSSRLPILENMGFRGISERTYEIQPAQGEKVCLHDMLVESSANVDIATHAALLEELFMAVWNNMVSNDGHNKLALTAKLDYRRILMLRAFTRYLEQVSIAYNRFFLIATINRYPKIASMLIDLFSARFAPVYSNREKSITKIRKAIDSALNAIASFDEDRIIRHILAVILATVRTNFFQTDADGNMRPAIAVKLDPSRLDFLPAPSPFREIFVYSSAVEGVHLRFGKVARGGLRWSDRARDYRTEVLGLVKAQQVKNAVIVPVGAKGCFVAKTLKDTDSRDEFMAKGIRAYKTFIASMLDITDNLDGTQVVLPPNTVCYDENDPYLVVAADKGTASFSDIANSIAIEDGFWLGDAFASGGSAGYDHKKMGITARGAWESVKRHFRELGTDIQKQPFSVVGVGDMSGDVFGNGMLLSPCIQLVAAFDHRDIFLDPEPDIKTALAERKRLFALTRSSWQDYNKTYISPGGGVFSRSQKTIPLSAAMQKLLGIGKASVSPQEVIVAILQMQTDLLWFGGIGTYVRASSENNADVGDKANDAIRVRADQLRCRVIGEGANLGLTQKARIEFNQLGGNCYLDAIDNSAGVNSSDIEVNVKIALSDAIASGALTSATRNKTLAGMTTNVAALCLENNYYQGLSISLTHRSGVDDLSNQEQLMRSLEERNQLNRELEQLPSSADMIERQESAKPLTKPEIGVLLAYSKIALFDDILASTLPDDPYMKHMLPAYFPKAMHKAFATQLQRHKLHREILATMLANSVINFAGASSIARITHLSGKLEHEVVKAYVVIDVMYDVRSLFAKISALDGIVTGQVQLALYETVRAFLNDRMLWASRWLSFDLPIDKITQRFVPNITKLKEKIFVLGNHKVDLQNAVDVLRAKKVPTDLALSLAKLQLMGTIGPITMIAEASKRRPEEVATMYYQIADMFIMNKLIAHFQAFKSADSYDLQAVSEALAIVRQSLRRIVIRALTSGKAKKDVAHSSWLSKNTQAVDSARESLERLARDDLSVGKASVIASTLARLANL